MTPHLPSIDVLRDQELVPRVHPNGFIQVDLDVSHHLHVWHPSLPYRQKTYHPIHDHTFYFRSYVYSGRMVHVVYELKPESPGWPGTHTIWRREKQTDEETILKTRMNEPPVIPMYAMVDVIQPGMSYFFAPFKFHESLTNEPTLTIITKKPKPWGLDGATPRILVPIGVEPDNTFIRADVNRETLWKLIGEAHPG